MLRVCVKNANGSVGIAKTIVEVKPASNRNSDSK